jgi:hypothetical protein
MKMAVLWVVASCSLVEVHRRFRGPCCLHHQSNHRPDDGGSKDLWKDGKLLPDHTALQPRRQPSSYSPPWEPQILLFWLCFRSVSRNSYFNTQNVLECKISKWINEIWGSRGLEDGGNMLLRNVGTHQVRTASQPKRPTWINMRLGSTTMVKMPVHVWWVVTPCGLVGRY